MTDKTLPATPPTFKRRLATPRPRTLIYILTVLVIILMVGIYWWTVARWVVETDDAYVRADIVTLSPRISGYLIAVNVDDNQEVKAGQIVAGIDTSDYQARVEQAEAQVKAGMAEKRLQQAKVLSIQARQIQQQSRIQAAQSAVRAAAADAELAVMEGQRQHRLALQNVSSQRQLESANALMTRSTASLGQARAMLAVEQKMQAVMATERQAAEAEYDKADAQRSQAQALLTIANINLASAVIRSPVAGTVGDNTLRLGQYVETGSPLMAVVPDQTYIIANFKETQLNNLRVGQSAEITVDAYNGLRLHGKIESFSPASGAQFALLPPDNATGNFTKIVQRMPVKIRLDPGQTGLENVRSGMSVLVSVDTHHG